MLFENLLTILALLGAGLCVQSEVTYRQIYDDAVSHHVPNNPLPAHILQLLDGTNRTLDDVYQYDIIENSGGVLHFGSSEESLVARASAYVVAWPYDGDCPSSSQFTSFLWAGVTTSSCHNYLMNGVKLNMYSIYVATGGSGYGLFAYQDNDFSCSDVVRVVSVAYNNFCTSRADNGAYGSWELYQ